jgi:hypothetical protein
MRPRGHKGPHDWQTNRVPCDDLNPERTHRCTYERGHDGRHSWEGAAGYGKPVTTTSEREDRVPRGWADLPSDDARRQLPPHTTSVRVPDWPGWPMAGPNSLGHTMGCKCDGCYVIVKRLLVEPEGGTR